MFRLLRNFTLTSALAIVLVTVSLCYVFYPHEVQKMVDAGEKQNIITARLLANAVRPELQEILSKKQVQDEGEDELVQRLNDRIKHLISGLSIVKVNFFSTNGFVFYSTDFAQIGEEKARNKGFLSAAQHALPSSKLSYRDQFSAFSRVLKNVALVETYIPFIDESSGEVQAVFALYSDMTSLVADIENDVTLVVAQLIIGFSVLSAMLFFLVRHADGVLKRQFQTVKGKEIYIREKNRLLREEVLNLVIAEKALQEANGLLEVKVQERTSELAHAVEKLNAENRQRQQAETNLRMLSTAVEQSPSSVVITDPQGVVEYANPQFFRVLGYTREEVIGKNSRMLKSGKMPREFYRELWQTITNGKVWRGEMLNSKKGGVLFWEEVSISPVTDEKNNITHFVAVKEDVSLRKSYENELLCQANHDSLTGLANRLLVKDRLSQSISRARRTGTRVAVLLIDLDDFKKVNDSLGHSAGDELLIETARRLEQCVRATDTIGHDSLVEGDTVARLGGDEFVIILTDVHDPISVERVAAEILHTISRSYTILGQEIIVSNSIGITLYPDDGDDIEELMRNADLAMYKAKESGRGTFRFFTNEFNEMAVERLRLEMALRQALEVGELSLHYQPIISNVNEGIAGAEALLRWNSQSMGEIDPEHFIPIAESTGLIVEIGYWVLDLGLKHFAELASRAENADFFLSLNVSARQLREPGFADEFCKLVQRYDIPVERLKLEITESLILEETHHTQNNLTVLAGVGVRFSLDDFGTGYSSLRYLKKFPVDTLKVDRSFISDIPVNPEAASLVRSIAAMARGLGIQVIAEGVETVEQKHYAAGVGCQFTQGYLTGRPAPLEDFNTAVEESASALKG